MTYSFSRVLSGAIQEAHNIARREIGPEHFLLAIISDPSTVLSEIFRKYDITLARAREALTSVYNDTKPCLDQPSVADIVAWTPDLWAHSHLVPESTLLAIINLKSSLAIPVLERLGVQPASLDHDLREAVAAQPRDVIGTFRNDPLVADMIVAIERLEVEKEAAVSEFDMAKASQIRICQDELRARTEQLLRDQGKIYTPRGQE